MHSGYGVAFYGKSSWSFNDYIARNVIMIYGVDNSSSSHTDNLKDDFQILDEVDTLSLKWKLWYTKKKKNNFSKAKITFCLSLHYNSVNSYLIVNGKETYKFKASNKNNFRSQFCLRSISNKFDRVDTEEVSFKGNVYDFSVDYDAINKSNILNIHKYLMIKNSI